MRLDGHHGATGGFPVSGAKRRRIAFPDLHTQGCALCMFVMRRSIGIFAAAQQTMVFMMVIKITFQDKLSVMPFRQHRHFNKLMRIKPNSAYSGKIRPPC
jgi:hypothetical protein